MLTVYKLDSAAPYWNGIMDTKSLHYENIKLYKKEYSFFVQVAVGFQDRAYGCMSPSMTLRHLAIRWSSTNKAVISPL